jgi:hypothetical protein
MRSILSVTTAATVTNLTTLERVKAELSIIDSANDTLLRAKIREASSDINARAWADPYETLTETFWGVSGEEYLTLSRRPNVTISGVMNDDDTNTYYRIDPGAGILYCLDSSGYRMSWACCKSITISYSAGYIMPGQAGANLEPALEAAAIELLQAYWMSRGRDPLIRSEDVPGLGAVTYWVGAVGESGELPPSVESRIAPFRRTSV